MRNSYDLLKALAILLVVIGHTTNHYTDGFSSLVTQGIYLFHMPLFVALSGAVYELGCQRGKYDRFGAFFANKVRRLLVPLIFTGALVLAPTLVLCGLSDLGWAGTVVDIWSGGTSSRHLWYLQVLLLIFPVAWVVKRLGVSPLVFLGLAVFASCVWNWLNLQLGFFHAGLVFQYLPFFALGQCAPRILAVSPKKLALSLGGGFVLWACLYLVVRQSSVATLPQILLRSLILIALLRLGEMVWRKAPRWLDVVLHESFGIYLYHVTFIYAYRALFEGALPIGAELVVTFAVGLFGGLLTSVIVRRVMGE